MTLSDAVKLYQRMLGRLNSGRATLAQFDSAKLNVADNYLKKRGIVTEPDYPSAARAGSEAFERFWKAYPRKIGKRKALLLWNRLRCEPVSEKVIAAVERQKESDQWRRDGGQFIPHPTTWLNRGGWEDEPEPTRRFDGNQIVENVHVRSL